MAAPQKTDPPVEGNEPPAAPETITAEFWAIGDHLKQVQVAGLVADKAELRHARLTAEEWAKHVADYLESERV